MVAVELVVFLSPSLFVGGVLGLLYARFINLFATSGIPEKNMALVGMAGVMAGVMHAPLTGIFLIAEITGGYELFYPINHNSHYFLFNNNVL